MRLVRARSVVAPSLRVTAYALGICHGGGGLRSGSSDLYYRSSAIASSPLFALAMELSTDPEDREPTPK